jgi:hypothetical protein
MRRGRATARRRRAVFLERQFAEFFPKLKDSSASPEAADDKMVSRRYWA